MKIFFDCEFFEDGKTIDLISIGLVRADRKELYLVSSEFNESQALKNDWLLENVLCHVGKDDRRHSRQEIAAAIRHFVGPNPEFWAYYADYDWVSLCQLYGTMFALPADWPHYCRDLKQLADNVGYGRLPQQFGIEHHALHDARWVRESFYLLEPFVERAYGIKL